MLFRSRQPVSTNLSESHRLPPTQTLPSKLNFFLLLNKFMDSGNSGSMQSSSGGDDEYDVSRSDPSLAAFMSPNTGNTPTEFPSSFAHHRQRRHHLLPPSALFDSMPGNVDSLTPSQPTPPNTRQLLNLGMPWPAPAQSCTDIAGSLMGRPSDPPVPPPPPSSSETPTSNLALQRILAGTTSSASSSDQTPAATAATPRSSKKRPRASRRAPTTVLTTDTSNFRQMVQEFTGIPAPPFSSGALPRARFDAFNAAAASSLRSPPGTSVLLRPFAQKMSIPIPSLTPNLPFSPFATASCSSSSHDASGVVATTPSATTINPCSTSIDSMTTTAAVSFSATTVCANPNSTVNFQVPADFGALTNQVQSGLMQSQLQAYRSLFRSVQQPTSPSQVYNMSTVFGSNAPAPTTTSSTPPATGGRDQHDFSSGEMISSGDTLTRLFGSERVASRGGGGGDDLLGWEDGSGLAGGDSGGDHTGFRRPSGQYASSPVNNFCKMNHSASPTSDFHAENRSDMVNSSRGEGTLDSWICSSDDERSFRS